MSSVILRKLYNKYIPKRVLFFEQSNFQNKTFNILSNTDQISHVGLPHLFFSIEKRINAKNISMHDLKSTNVQTCVLTKLFDTLGTV